MGFLNIFRGRGARQSVQIVGHIADTPQIVIEHEEKYLMFCLAEAGETKFRLRMLPTTPMRRKGDRVAVMCTSDENGLVMVEGLYAAPDAAVNRSRNAEYLVKIQAQSAGGAAGRPRTDSGRPL